MNAELKRVLAKSLQQFQAEASDALNFDKTDFGYLAVGVSFKEITAMGNRFSQDVIMRLAPDGNLELLLLNLRLEFLAKSGWE